MMRARSRIPLKTRDTAAALIGGSIDAAAANLHAVGPEGYLNLATRQRDKRRIVSQDACHRIREAPTALIFSPTIDSLNSHLMRILIRKSSRMFAAA